MRKRLSFFVVMLLGLLVFSNNAKAETYYFDNTNTKWEHISVWSWSAADLLWEIDNELEAWPGIELSKDDATGYYVWRTIGKLPSDGAVMFNNGSADSGVTVTEQTCNALSYAAFGSAGKVCVPTVKNTADDEVMDWDRKQGQWFGEWKEVNVEELDSDNFSATISQSSFSYTGNYIKPVVTVKGIVNGKEVKLINKKDYKVTYKNFKNPGTATIIVTGIGKYSGNIKLNFTIRPISISKFKATIKQSSFTYTGTYIRPVVTVKGTALGKAVTLTKGKDYTVSYENSKDAGKATIVIKGKGIYGGTKKINFTIKPANISKFTASLNQTSFTYTGNYIKPVVNVKGKLGGRTLNLANRKDFKLTYSNFKNPGKATITVTGKGNYTGTKTLTFTIKPKVSNASLKSVKAKAVTITWDKCPGVTGYEIYRATSKTGKYTKIATVKTNTYTNSGLKSWTKYYYKVRAYKTIGKTKVYSSYSSVVTAAKVCISGHSCGKATCETASVCKNCGFVKQKALGHNFGNKKLCTRCKKSHFDIVVDGIVKANNKDKDGNYIIQGSEKKEHERGSVIADGQEIKMGCTKEKAYSIKYNPKKDKLEFCYELNSIDYDPDIGNYHAVLEFVMGDGDKNINVSQVMDHTVVGMYATVNYTLPIATYYDNCDCKIIVEENGGKYYVWSDLELESIAKDNNSEAMSGFNSILKKYTGYDLKFLGFKKYK